MRFCLVLILLGGCLPQGAGSFTPPMRFGIFQSAQTLDPKEHKLTVGHAQSVAIVESPDTGRNQLKLDAFIELNARLQRGISKKLEAQITTSTLIDQRIFVGRGGVKYQLPSFGSLRMAVEGGLGLGVDGSQSLEAGNTTQFIVGGVDGTLILSGPRDWAASPYVAFGGNANGTFLTVGKDENGNQVNGQSPLFAPHVTTGVDLGFKNARVMLETTGGLVLGPPETAAFNLLVGFAVSFGVGKVRHIPPWERIPEGIEVYSNCQKGYIEVEGECYKRCPEVLNRCQAVGDVCVLIGSEPKCRLGQDLPSLPKTDPVSPPVPTTPTSIPTSVPTPTTAPSSLPESAPATSNPVPTSEPDSLPETPKEPASAPVETRDDLTICLAKDDNVSVTDRISVCKRYLEENPDSSFALIIETRLLELESQK